MSGAHEDWYDEEVTAEERSDPTNHDGDAWDELIDSLNGAVTDEDSQVMHEDLIAIIPVFIW